MTPLPNAAAALVVVLAQSVGSSAARPTECGVTGGLRSANVWERAKEPNLRQYCALLASGSAKLVGAAPQAGEVPALAAEAEKLLPGRAAPKVLEGRAHLRLGAAAAAVRALSDARERDERALDDPIALLAWARANARLGKRDVAAEAYRAALPRAGALPPADRSAASFEAGLLVMMGAGGVTAARGAQPDGLEGVRALDDAASMLRQARREATDALSVAAVAALALALDRGGHREEARAVLAERNLGDVAAAVADKRVAASLADAGAEEEAPALVGAATSDTTAAREAWRRYLAGPGGKGPWAEHARARAVDAGTKPKVTR